MAEILQIITSKSDWQNKIKDQTIIKKWEEELQQQKISPVVFYKAVKVLLKSLIKNEYQQDDKFYWHLEVGCAPKEIWKDTCHCSCMICSGEEHLEDSLQDYEEGSEEFRELFQRLRQFKRVRCSCVDYCTKWTLAFLRENIYYKMNIIKPELKERFKLHVEKFQANKSFVDYHPGSNNQMLDIIHPSLFCYVQNLSEIIFPEEFSKYHDLDSDIIAETELFQWLPAEFHIHRDSLGKPIRTEILSEINNLPRDENMELYDDIAEIFTHCIPGFEKVIRKLIQEDRIKKIAPVRKVYQSSRFRRSEAPPPQPPHPITLTPELFFLEHCQIIVKIASCEVNSENQPIFDEGSWHLEGIDNEKILATCIYYYQMENIQSNYLRFRTTISNDVYNLFYPQNCFEYVQYHYNMNIRSDHYSEVADLSISLGRIPTKENLCLFFPNFLQHKVSKISVAIPSKDKTKEREGEGDDEDSDAIPDEEENVVKSEENKKSTNPTETKSTEQKEVIRGKRNILVFFLVNPFERVVSTANVTMKSQQKVMTLEEAKAFRELLMFERKYEYSQQNAFHQRGLSLCEH